MDNGASSYRRYLNGDEEAFSEIVKEYFDSLLFFIDRYVHDYAAAEDIAIDGLLQLIIQKEMKHGQKMFYCRYFKIISLKINCQHR